MLLFRRNVRSTAIALFILDLLFFAAFDTVFLVALRNRSVINNIEGFVPVLVSVIAITLTLTYAVGLYRRDSIAAPLLAHAEDAADHDLPLLAWYGLIPLADTDGATLQRMMAAGALQPRR